MFVGDEHHRVRDGLLDAFDDVRTNGMPAMVVLSGAAGWGKTRVIQEFYRSLAAAQPAPGYWPRTVGAYDPATLDANAISKSRKRVRLAPFAVPADSKPEWLWLAPAGQQVGGVPLPIVDDLQAQLAPHVAPILLWIERRRNRARAIGKLVRAVAPVPDFVGVVEGLRDLGGDARDVGETVSKELKHLRQKTTDRIVATAEYGASRVTALVGMFDALFVEPVGSDRQDRRTSIILVLDDAHLLDAVSVDLVRRLMAMELALLVVCTTWPEELTAAGRSQFAEYVHDAQEGPVQLGIVEVPAMAESTLVELVLERFPQTDPALAHALAAKADGNPYQLLLMLAADRIDRSVQAGAITLDVKDVMSLPSTIASWLRVHWDALSKPVRRLLMATAILEERFAVDVATSSVSGVADGVQLTPESCSDWITVVDADAAVSEFLERPRFELARDAAGESLGDEEVAKVAEQALAAIHKLLEAGTAPTTRQVVLAMHLSLAERGYEPDFNSAARSAMEIARGLRNEKLLSHALEVMEHAATWAERAAPPDPELKVRTSIEAAALTRLTTTRSRAEARARGAYEIAVQSLPVDHEARLAAAIELARSLRRRKPRAALIEARALIAAVGATIDVLEKPSSDIRRDYEGFRASLEGFDGNWVSASEMCAELLATCDVTYGRVHYFTLGAAEDLGFYRRRAGDVDGAITARREVIERRTELSGHSDSLQLSGCKNELAVTLCDVGTAKALAEAAELNDAALRAREATYGRLSKHTLNVVSARSKINFERGRLEEATDPALARAYFVQALADAERLVAGREALGLDELSNGLAFLRLGSAQAGVMDQRGHETLLRARAVRRDGGDPDDLLHAIEIEEVLAWAADRLGITEPGPADVDGDRP